jgi:hypothetical protein
MAPRTRVGVIGRGLIAQVMHLPYLAELSDRFEVDGVLAALNEMGYDGWLVVEQDMIPESDTPVQRGRRATPQPRVPARLRDLTR